MYFYASCHKAPHSLIHIFFGIKKTGDPVFKIHLHSVMPAGPALS